jgi:hypothetical protein
MKGDSGKPSSGGSSQAFAALMGVFLGLAFLKFGNPPIMAKFETAPTNVYEFVMGYPWPSGWAYGMLVVVVVVGLWLAIPEPHRPNWLIFLPGSWFAWQFVASIFSVDFSLTQGVLKHFAACSVCFYLGYFFLSRAPGLRTFFLCLLGALVVVVMVGWDQHFGGLEQTRKYFYLYIYPQLKEVPPEYIKKIGSNRIFGTLFYPNTLAGAVLLLLPISLTLCWEAKDRFTLEARLFLVSIVGFGSLAALVWSGSKGGWLLALLLASVAMGCQNWGRPSGSAAGGLASRRRLKIGFATLLIVIGLTFFFLRYADFFHKGATSVSARGDYWRAAVQITVENPVVGTGPGTFSKPYAAIKRPESEMARLVHNDYLEQASDSGIPGALLYAVFVFGALVRGFKKGIKGDALAFAAWLGVLGWGLHSFIEFGLYVPALSWTSMTLLGWLLARGRNPLDKAETAR